MRKGACINDGIAFEEFRDNLTPILQAKGWWGRRPMIDPLTGEEREVQLGSNRCLQIIYDTNLSTSYAVGAYEQSMRAIKLLRYWRYVDPSAHPRAQHLAWSDAPTVLRKDDPWWAGHLPPLAYKCHCYVDDLGEKDLERYPLTIAPPTEYYGLHQSAHRRDEPGARRRASGIRLRQTDRHRRRRRARAGREARRRRASDQGRGREARRRQRRAR